MEINLKNITKRLEFKSAILFGAAAFFISILVGLLNRVDFIILLQRIFLVEIIFIPMGMGIGYILNLMVFTPIVNTASSIRTTESNLSPSNKVEINPEKEKETLSSNVENTSVSQEVIEEPEEEIVAELENVEMSSEELSELKNEVLDTDSDTDKITQKPVSSSSNIAEEVKKIKTLHAESLGKYIIVDDKRIPNDPEVLAKTVRTMMNRD